MSVDLEVMGINELIDRVNELRNQTAKIQNQALLKAAEPLLDEAVRTTTFTDKTGRLRKSLKIIGPRSKDKKRYVLVGIDKNDITEVFYGRFHEFGTSHEPARPFLGPAYERHKKEALEIIKNELRQALKL
jgi:HK97 gp10 family phage protein